MDHQPDHCPACGHALHAPAVLPAPPVPPGSAPAGYRWLEASLGCPECLEPVEVLTGASQGDDEHDEQVYVHAGDLYLCGGGHLGSVTVAPGLGGAYLGDPALSEQTRESAEAVAVHPIVAIRAPLRRGGAAAPGRWGVTRPAWMEALTVRAANVLWYAGVSGQDQLMALSDSDILRMRNAGRRVLDELRARGLRPDSCSSSGCQLPVGHGGDHVTFESRYAVRPGPTAAPRRLPRRIVGRVHGVRADLEVGLDPELSDRPDGVVRPLLISLRVDEPGGPGRAESAHHHLEIGLSVAEAQLLCDELRLRLLERRSC